MRSTVPPTLLVLLVLLVHGGAKPSVQDQLMKAAAKGQLKKVRAALAGGARGDYQDLGKGEGKTPMMLAAQNGHGTVVSTLMKDGVMLERADKEGWTALMHAIDKRQFKIARTLLGGAKKQKKLDKVLGAVTKGGATPLLLLATSMQEGGGDKEARKLFEDMVKRGAGVGGTNQGKGGFVVQGLLQTLAQRGAARLVRLVLRKGANKDERDESGVTPLMSAAVAGHDDVVRELLEHRADAALADEYGKTALHQCSLFCSPAAIEALVAAAPAARVALDRDGNTAHDMAKMAGRSAAVLQLLLPPPGGTGGGGQREEL